MKDQYEQLELDTRSDLERAISTLTADAIADTLTFVEKNCESSYDNLMPRTVRNRYEAYGVAVEQMVSITNGVKRVKGDVQKLLDTLSDPNMSAVEATSSIFNGIKVAAERLITAAAIMNRTMSHLYEEEYTPTPLDELTEQDYQETDESETDNEDMEE